MAVTGPRLPGLGLQYAYTAGGCRVFAAAVLRLPAGAGGTAVTIEDDEDRDHCAVLLPDGRLVDAEGVRTRAELHASFGFQPGATETPVDVTMESAHLDALVAHLTALGWDQTLPEHDWDRSLADHFEEAKRDFDGIGGWSGDPVSALAADRGRMRPRGDLPVPSPGYTSRRK